MLISIMNKQAGAFMKSMRGNVALIFAIALVPITGAGAFGVDWSRSKSAQADLQSTLDASTLAGAIDNSSTWTAISEKMFDEQFNLDEVTSSTRTFTRLPNGDFNGTANASVKTIFGSLIGVDTMAISAQATARRPSSVPTATITPPPNDICGAAPNGAACILTLDRNSSSALLFNSSASLSAPSCEVHGHSNDKQALFFNTGAALAAKRTCVKGDAQWTEPQPPSANFESNCKPDDDPYANRIPPPTFPGCTYRDVTYDPSGGAPVTMPAGGYCGEIAFNGPDTIIFGPGVHYLRNGRIKVAPNANIIADGAVFYFEDETSNLQMNGAINFRQTPPQTGPYAGISMFEAPGLGQSQIIFNTGNGLKTEGVYYLPSREVVFNSGAIVDAQRGQFVVRRFILNTASKWNLEPYGGVNAVIPGTRSATPTPPTSLYPASLTPTPTAELGSELIGNGSFENVSGTRTQYYYQGKQGAAIANWTGLIDWEVHVAGHPPHGKYGMTTFANAKEGQNYAEVDAYTGADRLEQIVQGTAGAAYELSFWYGALIANDQDWSTNQFDVYWNDEFVARIYPTSTSSWQQAVYQLVGKDGPNTLSFRELPCTDNNRGGLIDLVSLKRKNIPTGNGYPFLVK
jgi:Flp pilus assembly protein TadG